MNEQLKGAKPMSLLDTPVCCRSCYFLSIPRDLTILPKCRRNLRLPTKHHCKLHRYSHHSQVKFNDAVVENHARIVFNERHPWLFRLCNVMFFSALYTGKLETFIANALTKGIPLSKKAK